jgi:hypothetical protein
MASLTMHPAPAVCTKYMLTRLLACPFELVMRMCFMGWLATARVDATAFSIEST